MVWTERDLDTVDRWRSLVSGLNFVFGSDDADGITIDFIKLLAFIDSKLLGTSGVEQTRSIRSASNGPAS
jgi:hypothetical protein